MATRRQNTSGIIPKHSKFKKQKYGSLGPIPSLVGFAVNSAKSGEIGFVKFHDVLYNLNNATDNDIANFSSSAHRILVDVVFPLVLQRFSGEKLPDNFGLYAVYIEMHGDETKNKILINEDTRFHVTCKLLKGLNKKKNEVVAIKDIDHFVSIEKKDRDHNAATIMLALNNNNWFGEFDLVYNRQNATKKIDRALDFLNSAETNLKSNNMTGFYESLWSSNELLVECLLLLHNFIKLKSSHKAIQSGLKQFCKTHNIQYINTYSKITQIRENIRYGPPHSEYKNLRVDAPNFLSDTKEFSEYVLKFLAMHRVEPSSDQYSKFNISSLKHNSN